MKIVSRIEKEKQTVKQMIFFYCRHKEGNKEICAACSKLLEYALERLSKCPFGEEKKTCRLCKTHCYNPKMKEHIREVMRYAGPRMMIYHPIIALKHLWRELD